MRIKTTNTGANAIKQKYKRNCDDFFRFFALAREQKLSKSTTTTSSAQNIQGFIRTMPEQLTIDDIPSLKANHVYMRDKDAVLRAIEKIRKGGANKLQIVTDFDLTLTKQHVNGKHVLSSFGMFSKCQQVPKTYQEAAKGLYEKYRPIEKDPNIPMDQKIEAMEEWMVASHKVLQGFEFNPEELDEVARKYGTALRDGCTDLIKKLQEAKVPVLVFSAGLGDVVQAVLKHHGVYLDNVKIISNFLNYDGNTLAGLKGTRLIHVFNKNELSVDHDYFNVLEGRHNVLLMGDMTGDARMAEGVKDVETTLKIGFLYEHVEDSLPSYMEAFDIVLVDDQTMSVPSDILQDIV